MNPPDETPAVGRWVVHSAITGTVFIAAGAFWLSFTALADLARLAGIPRGQAWVWPLIVDGVIVVATISVVALSRYAATGRRYAWSLLAGGAGVSVGANISHAAVAADASVPMLLAGAVASVPPVVLLAITHLTVILTRHHDHDSPMAIAQERAAGRQTVSASASAAPQTAPSPAPPVPAQIPTRPRAEQISDGRPRARALKDQGWSNRKIAAELGVHPATIGRWLGRTTTETSTQEEHHE